MLQCSSNDSNETSEENINPDQLRVPEKENGRMEMEKNKKQVRVAKVTPEQTADRRAKRMEYLRRKKQQTSPEELAMAAERAKTRRAFREAMETPEEYAIRRYKAAERERKRRLRLAKERLKAVDKPLEGEEKIKKEMELKKRRDKFRASKEKESPEQAAARRAKANARQKMRREQMQTRKEESPEQAAARRARKAEYERRRRKEITLQYRLNGIERPKRQRKRETRKQAVERRARIAEMQKMKSDNRTISQNAAEELTNEKSVVQPDGVDEYINESCSWSSSYIITEIDEIAPVKNEPLDALVIQEIFEDNKDFASLKEESLDFEYKPHTSKQELEQKNIKTDIFDKGVGLEYVSGGVTKTKTNFAIKQVLQEIIVKQEVDL